jgi:hypothetical protein
MNTGKLRIGNHWNAITIIALSQNNPMKAIAEFVENSIDAGAKTVTVVRGREKGEHYLKVIDDGAGIPLDAEGTPDFKYVATHICDSIKKKLKQEGMRGIQGEFGIGLLSFWTVGERLIMSSSGKDGKTYQMEMKKGEQGYAISPRRLLFSHPGTELFIHPLLPGLRQLTGERIQHYLASELRDRIRKTGVRITIKDRTAKGEYEVKPREFTGRHLSDFDVIETEEGVIYLELYLNTHSPQNAVSLFRSGTRVLPSVAALDFFEREPWNLGYLQGMIDVPFLQITPGTRDGIVRDGSFEKFCASTGPIEERLRTLIDLEKKSEEEETSKNILKSVHRAFKEAFIALSREDYDWFDIYSEAKKPGAQPKSEPLLTGEAVEGGIAVSGRPPAGGTEPGERKEFYEHAGPLHKAVVSPSSCVVKVNTQRSFRCIPRDRTRRTVEENVTIRWSVKEGSGSLDKEEGEIVVFTAPAEPGMTVLKAAAVQGEVVCEAEAVITVSESLVERDVPGEKGLNRGIPGYTFLRATGELWRSRNDEKNNLIVINSGHNDYIFASQNKARKLKYICRLFAKELVIKNFSGFPVDTMLERIVELTLYTEENLR